MKKQLQFKNLVEVVNHFSNPQVCLDYLTNLRWSGSPECAHCGHTKVYELKGMNKRYKCAKCRKHFSATKGTIFENSPIPLQKWFTAIYLISAHKKGISSVQLAKDLSITQKSAWYLLHRIRFALYEGSFERDKLSGIVEIDETYLGGKEKNKHVKRRNNKVGEFKSPTEDKMPIVGCIERGGEVRAMYVPNRKKELLEPFILNNIIPGSSVVTDEYYAYQDLTAHYEHDTVNHSTKEYVRGYIHTNTIENFWSVFKRGIYGIYHGVSRKHLQNYIEEYSFRFNSRRITDAERFDKLVSLSRSKIQYKVLIAKYGSRQTEDKAPN